MYLEEGELGLASAYRPVGVKEGGGVWVVSGQGIPDIREHAPLLASGDRGGCADVRGDGGGQRRGVQDWGLCQGLLWP